MQKQATAKLLKKGERKDKRPKSNEKQILNIAEYLKYKNGVLLYYLNHPDEWVGNQTVFTESWSSCPKFLIQTN